MKRNSLSALTLIKEDLSELDRFVCAYISLWHKKPSRWKRAVFCQLTQSHSTLIHYIPTFTQTYTQTHSPGIRSPLLHLSHTESASQVATCWFGCMKCHLASRGSHGVPAALDLQTHLWQITRFYGIRGWSAVFFSRKSNSWVWTLDVFFLRWYMNGVMSVKKHCKQGCCWYFAPLHAWLTAWQITQSIKWHVQASFRERM